MISRSSLLALALTVAMPLAAFAQTAAPAPAPPAPRWTPSPEMQARMQRAHDDFRAAALSSLSPAHRSAAQAIIDQVNSGKLSDLKDATNRIDAVLTYMKPKRFSRRGRRRWRRCTTASATADLPVQWAVGRLRSRQCRPRARRYLRPQRLLGPARWHRPQARRLPWARRARAAAGDRRVAVTTGR